MKKTENKWPGNRTVQIIFLGFMYISIFIVVLDVVLWETNGLVLFPDLAVMHELELILELISVAFAVLSLPVALKGYSMFSSLADRTDEEKFSRWYGERSFKVACIIGATMYYNAMMYCLLGYPSALYCMAICLVSAFFAYPTKKRMQRLMKNDLW